ncbi:4'-phosphopantetheinyl transferase superfamily protein [Flavobacterium sp. H122]|uniref:4'-phosphopantetheinyl transferase family protein n=1 Tax=Flavobacterium sp. H122 TaxID=2529860 RepID=UPI0010AA2055|nr:4'-phosphopantetheinyl transferase superfamily protein [Flavobacterium sp. H122]
MPLFKTIFINNDTTVFLWKITEDYNELFRQVLLKDSSLARLEGMKSESHQKAFLSVRMLLQYCGYTDFDLIYDEFGKPHLKDTFQHPDTSEQDEKHISISHSFDFAAIALSNQNIGIDIEQVKEKVLRIAPRFMEMWHLENLSEADQMKKATVIWGTKEAIFKVKNEVGISFPDHIFEKPFTLSDKKCKAELHFNSCIENFDIFFEEANNYMLVCAFQS